MNSKDCGRSDHYDREWQNFQPGDGTYSKYPTWPFTWDEADLVCVWRHCAAECIEVRVCARVPAKPPLSGPLST